MGMEDPRGAARQRIEAVLRMRTYDMFLERNGLLTVIVELGGSFVYSLLHHLSHSILKAHGVHTESRGWR